MMDSYYEKQYLRQIKNDSNTMSQYNLNIIENGTLNPVLNTQRPTPLKLSRLQSPISNYDRVASPLKTPEDFDRGENE